MKVKWSVVCLVLVIVATAAVFGSHRMALMAQWNGNQFHTTNQQITSTVPLMGPVRNVRFILFDAGIYPNEVRLKPGLVNISIEDKTMNSSGLLVQQIVGGQSLNVGRVDKSAGQFRGRRLLTLLPGTYELQDSSKPANRALIVVE